MKNLFTLFLLLISLIMNSQNFDWAKSIGNTSSDEGFSICTDNSNNVYSTGRFQGTVDFDPNSNTFNITSLGSYDAFIQKMDNLGNFVWAKSLSGIGDVGCYSIKIDLLGNVYATGFFEGTIDFDPSANEYNLTSNGSYDIFILKLDSSGNFIWAKSMGSSSEDRGYSLNINDNGDVVVTGIFQETVDFDPSTTSTFNLTSFGMGDIFILKLNTNGEMLWTKQVGGNSSDQALSICLDSSENIYLTGFFLGTTDFDTSTNVFNLTSVSGGADIFIQKLDINGNLLWVKQIGGSSSDRGNSIITDNLGNIYTTGYYQGIVDFDPNSGITNLSSVGGIDIFIQKMDSSGNLIWAKSMGGGSFGDVSKAITLDSFGNIYTIGTFSDNADFDPSSNTYNLFSSGSSDIFISKLNNVGDFQWAIQIGGVGSDSGNSIAVNNSNEIFILGNYQGNVDFDFTSNTYNLSSAGGSNDVFIEKLNSSTLSSTSFDSSTKIYVYPNPTNNYINISSEKTLDNVEITISDLQGKIVFNNKYKIILSEKIDFDYPIGTYILNINSNTINQHIRIVKK